jgi:predicted ribosomally synthesized peptide with nif11-like leader
MSLKNVELFYERLLADETFKQKIQNAGSKEKCSLLVKAAGYEFTQQELEDYTEQSIKVHSSEQGMESLSERELETIAGGMLNFIVSPPMAQKYGGVPPLDWL